MAGLIETMANRNSIRLKKARSNRLTRSDQAVQPLSQQVSSVVRQRILAGHYEKNGTLPAELTIAREFKVSRHTVRTALQKLVMDGLIERSRGAGTRIVSKGLTGNSWTIDWLNSIVHEFNGSRLIFVGTAPAADHPEIAKLFRLNEEDRLFKVIRLLKSKKRFYAYSTLFSRVEFGEMIPRRLVRERSVIGLIEQYCGVKAACFRQTYGAVFGPEVATQALGLPPHYPMLRQRRQFLTRSGDLITNAEMFCRSDRYLPVVTFGRET